MLVLSIDTTGPNGSVALLRNGQALELVPLAGRTYSAQLMPQISALLTRHQFDKNAIDAFTAASGPGSFTGLRVGLSTVKALAEILQKPIAAVSLLEAIAWAGRDRGKPAVAALDAMRSEVYVGEYRLNDHALPSLVREVLMPLQEFAAEAQLAPAVPVLTPDETVAAALRARNVAIEIISRPDADLIGRLGAMKIAAGKVITPEALDANYIRRSDAEIFSKKT